MKTYPNLTNTGAMLIGYGNLVKNMALVIGGLGGLFGVVKLFSRGFESAFGGIILIAALLGGLSIHILGTIVAAAGESLQALADMATNSWPRE